jgi:hypothetical protein
MTSRLWIGLLALCAVTGSARAQSSTPASTAEEHAQADTTAAVPAAGSGAAGEATTAGTPSEAEQEAASAHFKMGVDFYRERNFRAALIEFKRAYRAAPHYKLLYNLGQASVELQENAPAIDYLSGYLRAGRDEIDPDRRKEVEQTILELEARIATVTIECEDGANISVDDESIGKTPLDRLVRVSAGRRRFTAERANGQRAERVLDVAAGDHLTVSLSFEARSGDAQANVEAVESAGGGGAASPGHSSPIIPWAIATTAVLAAGAGTVAVLTALAEKDFDDERRRETTKTQLDNLRDDAKTKALVTDVLLSATLAAGIVTTVLILTDTHDSASEHASNSLQLSVGPGAVALRGTL